MQCARTKKPGSPVQVESPARLKTQDTSQTNVKGLTALRIPATLSQFEGTITGRHVNRLGVPGPYPSGTSAEVSIS